MGKIVFTAYKDEIDINDLDGSSHIIYPSKLYNSCPKPGVYTWYFILNNKPIYLYVGRSKYDTRRRGISEAFRLLVSTDTQGTKYQKIDTDFVIGSLLKILSEQFNLNCYWEHIDNNPTNEVEFVKQYKPILQQKNSRIDGEWKVVHENGTHTQ